MKEIYPVTVLAFSVGFFLLAADCWWMQAIALVLMGASAVILGRKDVIWLHDKSKNS
ncbi:MAG: hypothetical protein LKK08_06105 [Bacteroidales bacterium]|jgi:hypothetical protein|nr:hypothetical protein [Bacteroidales bacterium]